MAQIQRNRNLDTKFQILVQIAANQPNIQQKDIAQRLDVTPQAVSEYIKEMVKDGSVTSDGRSIYRITNEGVNRVLKALKELRAYLIFVERSITNITICTAVSDHDLSQGQAVGLKMKNGLLFATNALGKAAKGLAVTNARKGEDVGVSNIEGIIEFEIGRITILKVPGIQRGSSRNVDLARLKKEISRKELVGTIGIEALIALRRIGIEPSYLYGVTEAAIEAAHSGLSFLILCTDDDIPNLLKRLEEHNLSYEILDLSMGVNLE
ncbi:MAG TPA: winged helix-turn-helix transcriptional regulator [Dehalococcoidia bacterium]|nr:winged helix-turn-helix transcriptional regulator [Dehalococcoidia bacterium]